MEKRVTVRHAEIGDLAAMKTIWTEFIDFHEALEPVFRRAADGHDQFGVFVADRMAKDEWCVLVAELEGEIVGHIIGAISERPPVFSDARFGYIQDAAVTGTLRRCGIGTALFNSLRGWFCDHGVAQMELDLVAANPISRGFWQKMGFRDLMIRVQRQV